MSAGDNGLSLEGLARRLEALERENASLRDEVAALKGTGRVGEPASEFDGWVSRRALLSKAGAAAVGLVTAGALTQTDIRPAQAAPAVFTTNTANRGAVEATNTNFTSGVGVFGSSARGVQGQGAYGVEGISNVSTNAGVVGHLVEGVEADGVRGLGGGARFAGVLGRNREGTGVRGEGANNRNVAGVRGLGSTGVWGSTTRNGYSGVYGQFVFDSSLGAFEGYGVVGDGIGLQQAGVLGRNPRGTGVRGESTVRGVHGKSTTTGTGVFGESVSGYGGSFQGGKAQLRIVPKPEGNVGAPSGDHTVGELYMDSAATLFVCVASGNPATWRRFTTTTA